MNTANKKVTHTMHSVQGNSNVDTFLSYYAYDVRWYIIGDRNAKNKEAFIKDIEGEAYAQKEVNQSIGESNPKLVKNI